MFVERLRKTAELNLCRDCFKRYKALIEPSIRSYVYSPLSDWRATEENVRLRVMINEGVFKSDSVYIDIGEEPEKVSNEVDVKAYKRIKKSSFKENIENLHKKGTIGEHTYRLLDRTREIRNKNVHSAYHDVSEEELALLRQTHNITSQIYLLSRFSLPDSVVDRIESCAEKASENLLSKIDGSNRVSFP